MTVLGAGVTVGALSLASRVLGFARTVLMAAVLGVVLVRRAAAPGGGADRGRELGHGRGIVGGGWAGALAGAGAAG